MTVRKSNLSTIHDERVRNLAENICKIHGPGRLAKEKSGTILYVPCPDCLASNGPRELKSQHLAVLLDKWIKILDEEEPSQLVPFVATCMRTEKCYNAKKLLDYAPITVRMPKLGIDARVLTVVDKTYDFELDKDEKGNKIPWSPGEVVPLPELEESHPARWYLENRGYNVDFLHKKFRASFCTKETPRDKSKGIGYKYLANQWKNTGQGRIIFYCDMHGVKTGWQGRYLEADDSEGHRYVYHPYRNRWEIVEKCVDGKLVLQPEYEVGEWPPAKYKNATAQRKNEMMYGFDAALESWKDTPIKDRYAVITEGPLDAARFGFAGLAVGGKSLTWQQTETLKEQVGTVILTFDNDMAGDSAINPALRAVTSAGMKAKVLRPPKSVKDFGEVDDATAMRMVNNIL